MLIFQPSRYIQRVVEHLSFLPAGGERWQRDIQIRVPTLPSSASPPGGKCIVSLGMFRRSRFPDFTVKDESDVRLNLVTRRQHQHCIAMTTLRQYLDEADWQRAPLEAPDELLTLYQQLAALITNIRGPELHSPQDVKVSAVALLSKLEKSDAEIQRVSSMLELASGLLARYTHYLCWAPANWGDTLSLSATYTMSDTVRVAGERRKAIDSDELTAWTRYRTRFYTSLSLVPVLYELRAPAHDHAGSYYFTIEPPEDAHVSILDWGHSRSLGGESLETDCAYATCHIHNGEKLAEEDEREEDPEDPDSPESRRQSIAGAKISAFLRADPTDHAALIAVALFNIGLAYLAQRGEFGPNGGASQQEWLLLAPTLVVALIAQHRRRYYSSVTRSVRIGLWFYLGINALFGASVAFDFSGGNKLDNVASASMAIFSLALLVLLVASSGLFERITNRPFLSKSEQSSDQNSEVSSPTPETEVNRYMRTVRRYADWTVATMVIVALIGLGGAKLIGWGSGLDQDRSSSTNISRIHSRPKTALIGRLQVLFNPVRSPREGHNH